MSTPTKKSINNAIINAKCPQCRAGNMFKHNWWQVTKFAKFYQHCPYCNLRFDREPGFFHGAMFISYAMIVAMVTTAWFILYFVFGNPAMEVYMYTIVLLNIVLLPIFFRYSRVLYLYAFGGVKFNSQISKHSK
ncbi:MAG: DUF983 domain-containing protein [Cyclobacteriaceae bacterium]|nr:DUF983 domain-containing protein [Cyclobacteriaceae bacterium]